MPFLIDGYNLLHYMGLVTGRVGPHGLAKARAGLLGLLSATHGDAAGDVTVVFDARRAPTRAEDGEVSGGGVRVEFTRHEEADDRIEWLIAHDAAPKRLVVVSDDHRLRQAARHRSCAAWKCAEYLDWLDRRRRERRKWRPDTDKPDAVSLGEVERWLAAFGDVQTDPAFRELFDTFGAHDQTGD
jgi:predicted RNA-binding protein with PIN domain